MGAFEDVAEAVEGIPYMTRSQGHSIFSHVRSTGATQILELGTAHGVSACYMAAALRGPGRVTTVDAERFIRWRNPQPGDTIARAGLGDRIDVVLVDDSSYTWWLKDRVAEHSDRDGNCAGVYDFCYIDGAHNWTVDGLAVILVEKLLKPGGWLLLDDLRWSYGAEKTAGRTIDETIYLSPAEMREPHIQAVWDLLVRQHPSLTETRVENDDWGWARKNPMAARRNAVIETALPLRSRVIRSVRRARRTIRGIRPPSSA
jgi:predicted O-methyltransferase YrrM